MALYGGGDILRGLQPVLGLCAGVPQPVDVEIVAAGSDVFTRKAAEAASLALVLARRFAIRVLTEGFRKSFEIAASEGIALAIGGRTRASVVNPHLLGS